MEQRWNDTEGIQRRNSATATFTTTKRHTDALRRYERCVINKKSKILIETM